MANASPPDDNPQPDGEVVSPGMTFTWITPGPIAAGEAIVPVKLSSPKAREFAALHLITRDLAFADDCLREADNLGLPTDQDTQSKALIFSGVVAYARCFKTGVREVKLNPDTLQEADGFDLEIHEYLIALRDKHVAHSVNDFEESEAIAVLVGKFGERLRDGSGIGVVAKQTVGISRSLLRRAIAHIGKLKETVVGDLEARRLALYAEFKEGFDRGDKFEMAPLVKMSDRSRISERRR